MEYNAVRARLSQIETLVHWPSGTRIERGRLAGSSWRVALAEIGEGNLTAATLTERIYTWIAPQALFFVGVAGGLKGDINIGDVVVATKICGIQGGKQTPEGFLVRPEAWHATHRLEQAARYALRNADYQVHFKPIAVGDFVLADAASAITRHLNKHYNDAVAIEMEGAGVAQASRLTGALDNLIIRGISDKADAQKQVRDTEGSQLQAARNAASAVVAVLRKLEPAGKSQVAQPPPASLPQRRKNAFVLGAVAVAMAAVTAAVSSIWLDGERSNNTPKDKGGFSAAPPPTVPSNTPSPTDTSSSSELPTQIPSSKQASSTHEQPSPSPTPELGSPDPQPTEALSVISTVKLDVRPEEYVDLDKPGTVTEADAHRSEFYVTLAGQSFQFESSDSRPGTAVVEFGLLDESRIPDCAARDRADSYVRIDDILDKGGLCVLSSEDSWVLITIRSNDPYDNMVRLNLSYLES
ncbi:5'-methylthioadenosine/S-adenosylhomocysteine nucleosidase family protein [Streptomyces gottesmaniae]|uniref:5'-methylthioadenosine/S-adenosylhomocysteine nucleosidase family protein n=1 Tax=Streptomyces gottesmaniae TaxID=3075518 RepID=UPI003F68A705